MIAAITVMMIMVPTMPMMIAMVAAIMIGLTIEAD
jgi:hypothetical protein